VLIWQHVPFWDMLLEPLPVIARFYYLRDKVACQTLDSTTPFLPSECTKPELELVVETYILNTDTSRHQNLYFNTMILANSGVRGSLSQQDQ
jgi:hypothetical protein